MQWTALEGKTAYVADSTNIGVYDLGDGRCILIDSGYSSGHAEAIRQLLQEQGLRVAGIIITHAHSDHCGGNHYFQEQENCRILASPRVAIMLNHPILMSEVIYSAAPPRVLTNRYLLPNSSRVTDELPIGMNEIEGATFEILDLNGHSSGQIGVRTPDNIIFTGDALITPAELNTHHTIVIYNLEIHQRTLQQLAEQSAQLFIPSHGEPFSSAEPVVQANQEFIDGVLSLIEQYCVAGRSREQVVSHVIECYGMAMSSSQYYTLLSTISALLTGLIHQRRIKMRYRNGNIEFSAVR